jgi:4-amino-4-deoxychorismate lyase
LNKRNNQLNLLLESIRIHDGVPDLLIFHQQRIDRSRKVLFPKTPLLKLSKILAEIELPQSGTYKLRIEYREFLQKQELVPYNIRQVNTIRLVDAGDIVYSKKFVDRTDIRLCMEKKGTADDVLMVQHGHITDCSYSNVALFDGSHWYTPAWPMLRGTRREKLLQDGTLRPTVIRERDLANFEKIRLINAMLPWGMGPELEMASVSR